MLYVNSAQKCLTFAGYYANTFVRESARNIIRLTGPMPQEDDAYCAEIGERLKRVIATLFSIPLSVLSIPALGCYSLSACVGSGRFELITTATQPRPLNQRSIKTMSLNACFQDPFSTLTGGVSPPQEPIGNYPSRVAAVVHEIAQKSPDLFLGQEFDSLGAQDECIELLKRQGFRYFLRDLGSNNPNPIQNHSGLFAASKFPLNDVQFVPYPFEDRAGLAKWGASQGALTFTIAVGDINLRFVNVHLNYGEGPENENARKRQLQNHIAPLLSNHSVVFGDLNLNTARINLSDLGLPGFVNELEGQVTCTDMGKHILRGKSLYPNGEPCQDCEEYIDGLIYHPEKIQVTDCTVTPLFANSTLLTDHYATVATVHVRV